MTPTRIPYPPPSPGRWRRLYVEANAWGLWIAIAGIFTAVTFFLSPDALAESSVGQTVHPFDYAWNLAYGVGSLLLLLGLLRMAPKAEVLGLTLFSGATAINAIAIIEVRGTAGLSSAPLVLAAAIAAVARIHYLVRMTRGR